MTMCPESETGTTFLKFVGNIEHFSRVILSILRSLTFKFQRLSTITKTLHKLDSKNISKKSFSSFIHTPYIDFRCFLQQSINNSSTPSSESRFATLIAKNLRQFLVTGLFKSFRSGSQRRQIFVLQTIMPVANNTAYVSMSALSGRAGARHFIWFRAANLF